MKTSTQLVDALRNAITRLDTIGCRASCAPNDDAKAVEKELKTIMHDAYGMRDSLRATLAAHEAGNAAPRVATPALDALMANIRGAVWDRQSCVIGRGEFSPAELRAALAEYDATQLNKGARKQAQDLANAQRDAAILALVPAVREALDNATASLETMLAHFGAQCPDNASRELVATEARNVLQQFDALRGDA
jgi:hypothetical protein